MSLEQLLHEQAEGADLRPSSLDQITKRAGRIRRRRTGAAVGGVVAAVALVAGGVFAVNVAGSPSSLQPASGGPSVTTVPADTASGVTNDGTAQVVQAAGHDADHSSGGSPQVPWLWNGQLQLPDGTLVTPSDTTGLLKDAQILTYAAAPDQPGLYYALANLGQGHDPEVVMFGGGDGFEPEPSMPGGLVATPDGSKVAVLMHDMTDRGPGSGWTLRLHSAGSDSITWDLPHGVDARGLAGILADGTVVIDASGAGVDSASPLYLAKSNGQIEQLAIVGAPAGASDFSATSVSSTELAVTFTLGDEPSCWGTVSATTGQMSLFTCDGAVSPTFSPDGSKVVALSSQAPSWNTYDNVTFYDATTLKWIARYQGFQPHAESADANLHDVTFGPTLVWDHDSVLLPAYMAGSGNEGWTLLWLNPNGNPNYQYARSLMQPSQPNTPPPFVFAADSLRPTE